MAVQLFIISCTDSLTDNPKITVKTDSELSLKDNKVNLQDITKLVNAEGNMTRTSINPDKDIICIADEMNDTLLYVKEHLGGGWTIYSSDTRVPMIVAQSTQGSFDEDMENEAARIWIQSIVQDMKQIRHSPDEALNFTKKEIEANKEFWMSVSKTDEYIKNKIGLNETRAGEWNITLKPQGHYELKSSRSYPETYDSIYALTNTRWHQGAPFNSYCPLKNDSSGYRAPAGCTAIAGAQMLYFFNRKWGVPATAPSKAYCNGYVGGDYDWAQTDYNSIIWGRMAQNPFFAAPLIADVGRRLNTEYQNEGSFARHIDLVDKVFSPYGISCVSGNYDTGKLKESLLQGIPVVIGAGSKSTGELKGHEFIVDRYKRERIVTVNIYEYKWDIIPQNPDGSYIIVPFMPEKTEYTYSTPTISMIAMNWGWERYTGQQWFALTGDWLTETNDGTYNWNIKREMIYNFKVK